jgi:hypothetical protein
MKLAEQTPLANSDLEWAGDRERKAIEEENKGYLDTYVIVKQRSREAIRIAQEREKENGSAGNVQ